jgi:hypothetical protein
VSKKLIFLWFFILVKLFFHCWLINPIYDLHRDEYLHLDQAKHLAWGFYSVPPVTSWVSWIILQLGNGVFWIKFFPALFGALTMVVVWKTIEVLRGNLFALSMGAIAVICSGILRMNILYQPNSLDILFWTLFYFTIVEYISTNNKKWLLYAGIVFAFGCLNKYNIAFLLLGVLPAMLLTEHRKIFTSKYLYISVAIAVAILAPNIIWQYQNNFPVIHHMKILTVTQLVNVNRMDFLKEQVIFFIGSFFILIAAFISYFTYPPFYKYRLLFWAFVFTLLLFVYFKAKGYYAIGLYPIQLAFGSVYLEKILNNGWKYYLRPVTIAIQVLLLIPILKIGFPIQVPATIQQNAQAYKDLNLLRWEDGKDHSLPQDFADMLGWHELAAKVDVTYDQIDDSAHTLVLCDNYGQAGAINYYSKHKNIKAYCMEGDYYNWFLHDEKEIKNIVLVRTRRDTAINLDREKLFFTTVTPAGKIENKYAREQGTSIYTLKNAASPRRLREILIKENAP